MTVQALELKILPNLQKQPRWPAQHGHELNGLNMRVSSMVLLLPLC